MRGDEPILVLINGWGDDGRTRFHAIASRIVRGVCSVASSPLLPHLAVARAAEECRAAERRHRVRHGDPLRSDLPGSMATRCLVGVGCDLRHHSRHRPTGGLCARLRRPHPHRGRPFRPPHVPPSPSLRIRTRLVGSAVGEAGGGPRVFGWCRLAGRAAGATGTEHQTAGVFSLMRF